MSEFAGDIHAGTGFVSAPYRLDADAAKAYGEAIESPTRHAPRRGIHDDTEAARTAGFESPIAAGEHTIAVLAQFLAGKFEMGFLRGGRLEVALIRPVFFGDVIVSCGDVERIEDGKAELRVRVENQRGEDVLIGRASIRIGNHGR
jgi:hypothetical protein